MTGILVLYIMTLLACIAILILLERIRIKERQEHEDWIRRNQEGRRISE